MGRAVTRGFSTRGFSLVELLVAVAVLAVLAVGAGLAATRGGSGPGADAARLARAAAALRGLAVAGQETRGLHLTPQGMAPARRTAEGWLIAPRGSRWRARVAWSVAGPAAPAGAPQILFLPNGQTSGFDITFSARGAPSIRCAGAGWGAVTCE